MKMSPGLILWGHVWTRAHTLLRVRVPLLAFSTGFAFFFLFVPVRCIFAYLHSIPSVCACTRRTSVRRRPSTEFQSSLIRTSCRPSTRPWERAPRTGLHAVFEHRGPVRTRSKVRLLAGLARPGTLVPVLFLCWAWSADVISIRT